MNKNRNILITLLGAIMGGVIFLLLYGIDTLNFTNDIWLLAGERDQRAHYIGWEFFRNSQWHWPWGMMDGITEPEKLSIIYTDSIPWVAIIFKLFRNVLPDTFQYFGLWGLLCFSLQGAVAGYIVNKYIKNMFSLISVVLLFALSPAMIFRLYYHSELSAHFLLLLGFIPWVEQDKMKSTKSRALYWSVLFILASGIHIYFLPMLAILMFATSLFFVLQNKRWLIELLGFFFPLLCAIFSLYILGAFSGIRDLSSEGGLGYYSANINALFNPQTLGKIMPTFSLATDGQYEGYSYLGLGNIVLIIFALIYIIYLFATKQRINTYNFFYITVVFFLAFIIALSPTVTLGDHVLLEIPCGGIVKKIFDMFRATGRFMWIANYVIILIITICIGRYKSTINKSKVKKYLMFSLLTLCLLIQFIDLEPILFLRQNIGDSSQYSSKEYNALQSSFWDDIASSYDHIELIEDEQLVHSNYFDSFSLAQYAVTHGMSISNFAAARPSIKHRDELINNQMHLITSGASDEKTIYVFGNFYDLLDKKIDLNLYSVDGIVIGLKNNIDNLYDDVIPYDYSSYKIDLTAPNTYIAPDVVQKDGSLINSGENSEYVLYGPYVHLSDGLYTLELKYHYLSRIESTDFLDIASQSGTTIHSRKELSDSGILSISNLKLLDCNDYEFRVYVNQGNILSIDSLTITKINH